MSKEVEGHQDTFGLRYALLRFDGASGSHKYLLIGWIAVQTPQTVRRCYVGLTDTPECADNIRPANLWVITIGVPILHKLSDFVLGIGWFREI